jgi:hypothetical protein
VAFVAEDELAAPTVALPPDRRNPVVSGVAPAQIRPDSCRRMAAVRPSAPLSIHRKVNAGGGIRTHTKVTPRRILSPPEGSPKGFQGNDLRLATPGLAAQGKRATRDQAPDLAEVIDAWPNLPEPIRAGILAMIRSASGKRCSR